MIAGHHSQRRHLRDLAKIRNGIGAAVDGLNEADRLADAARSAETTGERLADPARRMARLVAIDKELSGPMTSDRRRERLEAEREALDAQLDRAVFASSFRFFGWTLIKVEMRALSTRHKSRMANR